MGYKRRRGHRASTRAMICRSAAKHLPRLKANYLMDPGGRLRVWYVGVKGFQPIPTSVVNGGEPALSQEGRPHPPNRRGISPRPALPLLARLCLCFTREI